MALRPKYINLACFECPTDLKEVFEDRMGVNQIPTWQVWKSKELVDQYVVVTSIDTVPKVLV